MVFVKLVKNILALTLVCVWISQIKGDRMGADDESSATSDTRIVYDQRQNGKYNIHVVIKDVAIIEMDQNEIADQNYSDEEYYYDEEDLTIKPISFKPTTTTKKPSTTTTTAATTTLNPTKTITFTTEYNHSLPENLTSESSELIDKEITTHTDSPLWTTIIPTTLKPEQLANTNVLSTKSPPTTHPAIDIKPRSKIEPIYAIEEPVLHPKYHLLDYNYGMPPQAESRDDSIPLEAKAKPLTNSRIYKVKVHRSHQPHHVVAMKTQSRRCRSNQYRDSRGNCRVKRSSGSILKRLFSMLVTLPMVGGGEQHNDD